MTEPTRPRAVGLNHIALEVGDIDEALAFYGRPFRFELRSKSDTMAFIDLGDQFIALQKGRRQPADDGRHFGLVIALRLSDMTIFNSLRRKMSCGAWVSSN
jgi:lactoylglutathione lyase